MGDCIILSASRIYPAPQILGKSNPLKTYSAASFAFSYVLATESSEKGLIDPKLVWFSWTQRGLVGLDQTTQRKMNAPSFWHSPPTILVQSTLEGKYWERVIQQRSLRLSFQTSTNLFSVIFMHSLFKETWMPTVYLVLLPKDKKKFKTYITRAFSRNQRTWRDLSGIYKGLVKAWYICHKAKSVFVHFSKKESSQLSSDIERTQDWKNINLHISVQIIWQLCVWVDTCTTAKNE